MLVPGNGDQRMRKPLGEILIETETCSQEQVEAALGEQRRLAARGHYRHLGAIMLEMEAISITHLHHALELQRLSDAEP